MVSPLRHPRGQQRDKIYREALRLELADMSEGVDLKKLREIARAHIEKAAAGDMQAIKELADRLGDFRHCGGRYWLLYRIAARHHLQFKRNL
jgi:hypothetical protein